jgi:hypothetical protein
LALREAAGLCPGSGPRSKQVWGSGPESTELSWDEGIGYAAGP